MGLFGKSKKEREKEYMNRLDIPLCLKEDFELIIDDVCSSLLTNCMPQVSRGNGSAIWWN